MYLLKLLLLVQFGGMQNKFLKLKNMKKNIFNVIMLIVFILVVSSCKKEIMTSDISTITYYPEFTYNGDEVIVFEVGDTFTDPGITAVENGVEIPVEMSVSGVFTGYSGTSVDMNTPDKYEIEYYATNSDGYKGYQYRTVWVAETQDLSTSLGGLYTSQITRVPGHTTDPGLEYVVLWEQSPGVYGISCAIGGWYDLWYGYGTGYAAQGMTITVNDIATNDFTFGGPIGVGAFGGSLTMDSMSVDSGAGTITFVSSWSFGYVFTVTLTQVSI